MAPNCFIDHPLVRIHVMDMDTGKYLKKTDKLWPVTSYFESERDNVNYILPMITQAYDFQRHHSTLPVWEELLILNENYNYFLQKEKPKVILIFELLDFISMNRANRQTNQKEDSGWNKIAWAFLKCTGMNGESNMGKKARLQFYYPPARFRSRGDKLEVFQWYESSRRDRYPSTLYITLKGIIPPDSVAPAARSGNVLQQEQGATTYDDLAKKSSSHLASTSGVGPGGKRAEPSPWTRLPGQLCKVPNTIMLSLPGGRRGTSVLRFSPDGKKLACGCREKDAYPIMLYEIPSGKLLCEFKGHYGFIYDLDWSKDNKLLLSSSADSTSRIWDCGKLTTSPVMTMPHPCFVYTGRFHPRVNKVVVTGGYDHVVRVWTLQSNDAYGQLLQEIEGHNDMVNAVCFDEEGTNLFTGDHRGFIRQWNVFVTDQPSKRGVLKDWTLNREINDGEIKGHSINSLSLHASGRRLLVHCKDNTLRMLDLRIGAVMMRYIGALNFRERIRSVLTPCSGFVVSGSEDSCAYMWNTETGDQVAMYTELGYRTSVCDVHFHPHDHIVAFCAYAENHPIRVYRYDHQVAAHEAGLAGAGGDSLGYGRAMSPTLTSTGAKIGATNSEMMMESKRTEVQTLTYNYDASESARLERVTSKLNSVSAFAAAGARHEHPMSATPPYHNTPRGTASSHIAPKPGTATLASTWGSTFDSSVLYPQQQRTPRAMSPPPSTFSPHSTRTGNTMLLSQHLQQATQQQKAGFSPIGKGGTLGGTTTLGRGPSFSLTHGGSGGKAQFQYQGPTQTTTEQGIALYDYTAMRSGDLSLVKGDVVNILYKDNENWWMGELPATGEQGFFPSNHVATGEEEKKADVAVDMEDFKLPQQEEDTMRKSTTTAVVENGQLKFISAGEESETEGGRAHRTKNRKKKKVPQSLTFDDETMPPRRHHRKKKSKAQESTA